MTVIELVYEFLAAGWVVLWVWCGVAVVNLALSELVR